MQGPRPISRAMRARLAAGIVFALLAAARAAAAFDGKPTLAIPIPTVTFTSVLPNTESGNKILYIPWIAQYASGVYKFASEIAGVLAAVMVIIGGFQYMTAGADAPKIQAAKKRMEDAVVGALLLWLSYALITTVNPNLATYESLRVQQIGAITWKPNETSVQELTNGGGLSGGASALDAAKGQPAPKVVSGGKPSGAANGTKGNNDVPFFNQCSGKNVQTPYLDINGLCKANPENNRPYSICSSGCGVTSAAMVVAFYKPEINNDGLPPDMAALSSKNGMRPCNPPTAAQKPCDCSGTAGSFFTSTKTMGSFGLQGEYIGCTSPKCSKDFRNKVMDLLKQGKPLITVVGKSIFTGGGHYIVLTGVNGQGNITVNDPNSGSVVKTYSDGTKSDNVPPDKIFGLIGGVWYVHP